MVLIQLLLRIIAGISLFFASNALAYTYLAGGKGIKQDLTGRITFYRSDEVPTVEDKANFEDGIYANFSDEEIYDALAERAAALWNAVPGKFYTIEIVNDKSGTRDSKDGRNSITLFSESENKGGGDAMPVLDSEGQYIEDCDIRVSRTITVEDFGIVLAHEMGHCLGLGHEHKDLNAVMSYNRNKFTLTLDDAAGVASIYPEKNAGPNSDFQPCGTVAVNQMSSEKREMFFGVQKFMLLFFPLTFFFLAKLSKKKRRARRSVY